MTNRLTPARARGVGVVAVLVGVGLLGTASAGSITVRSGDTLSGLAQKHGVSVAALKAANGRAGSMIYAGETLRVPGSTAAKTSSRSTTETSYVVRPGDTVTAIARRQGTSIAAIVQRNGLGNAAQVKAGQRIAVPSSVRGVPAAQGPSTTTVARGTVGSSAAGHRSELKNRKVPSKDQVRVMIRETAGAYGVPASLALAVAYQESGFQQRVVSGVDAIGVMQVLPRTGRNLERAAGRPLDLLDARDNITAGVLLLRQLMRSQGTVDATLAGYYQGIGSIAKKGILPQTTQYIANIHILQNRFANG